MAFPVHHDDNNNNNNNNTFQKILPRPDAGVDLNVVAVSSGQQLPGSRHRRILPKPGNNVSPLLPATSSSLRSGMAVAACSNCRRSKIKCDAGRPSCKKCISKRRICSYTTLPGESRPAATKRKQNDLQQEFETLKETQAELANLLDALRSRSDAEAAVILQQLREGSDVSAILRNISAGDLLLQVRMVPETKRRYALPYGDAIPQHLQISDNQYLRSSLYEVFSHPSTHQTSAVTVPTTDLPQYVIPYLAARIEDSKLDEVKPSLWTAVSTNDELMRELLHAYFLHEYHWLPIFRRDYFLDDMLSGSTSYCSSLLVNAVLALACSCYSALPQRFEYWNPHNLGYKFFAEAKRLWELERHRKTTLTTLQAAHIVNIVLNAASMDKIGTTYCIQAIAMANELRLFKPIGFTRDMKKRHSYAFTAWALFFWTSVQGYHFRSSPLIANPPDIPLPDPEAKDAWYDEFWIRYPSSAVLIPMKAGHTFKAKCEFAVLINRINTDPLAGSSPDVNKWQKSAHHILELQKWFHALPISLQPARIVFPSQLKLHLIYHNVMIELCTAMVARTENSAITLTFEPSEVLGHSRACFETLLRLYYIRHSFQSADTYMLQPLMELGFTAVQRLKNKNCPVLDLEHARGQLMLSAKGLTDQGKIYQIMFTVFHVLDQEMDREHSKLAHRLLDLREEDESASLKRVIHTQAEFVSNIVDIGDDPEEQRLGNLITKYANLAVSNASEASDEASLPENTT